MLQPPGNSEGWALHADPVKGPPCRELGGAVKLTARVLCGLLLIPMIGGCYSMLRVERSPEVLRAEIHAGRILRVGDEVVLTTRDGKSYEFVISEITAEQVLGPTQAVDIDEIETVKRRQLDERKVHIVLVTTYSILFVGFIIYAVHSWFAMFPWI
jgi:hypothetical protein